MKITRNNTRKRIEKKLLALSMCSVLALSLAGCGSKNADGGKEQQASGPSLVTELKSEKLIGLQAALLKFTTAEKAGSVSSVSLEEKEILGEEKLTGVITVDKTDQSERKIELDGLFVAIGGIPTSGLVDGLVDLNPQGYIITGEDCQTSVDGIYAVGDIRVKSLRQVITAAADGAIAVHAAEKYILEHQ